MFKKQKILFKKIYFFLFLLIFSSLKIYGQTNSSLLKQADSLFASKKYTESFEIYEQIFQSERESSTAMLLKMAYIKEGLGDYTKALFYLNVYFNKTLDDKALTKINEIAESNELLGYENNEKPFFQSAVLRFLDSIRYLVTIFLIVSVTLILWYNRKTGSKSLTSYLAILVVLVGIILVNNIQKVPQMGIISSNSTYLMSGPSGAADVITIVEKGHKVEILDKEGAWVKINWNGEEVFLRNNKILEII